MLFVGRLRNKFLSLHEILWGLLNGLNHNYMPRSSRTIGQSLIKGWHKVV